MRASKLMASSSLCLTVAPPSSTSRPNRDLARRTAQPRRAERKVQRQCSALGRESAASGPEARPKAASAGHSIPSNIKAKHNALQSLLFTTSLAATLVLAGAAWSGNGSGATLTDDSFMTAGPKNVLGQELAVCSTDPMTGFMRSGRCETGPADYGTHTVCARVTKEFLQYTLNQGNDLITPRPEYRFPGLKEGDGWCLCAGRWAEALRAGVAPPVVLEATHEKTLQYVEVETLQQHAAQ